MSLNVRAMAAAGGLLWGGAVMATGIANLVRPKYGKNFLELIASIYPGYRGRPRIAQVAVGTFYATLDGAVAGALCAWLYNKFEQPALQNRERLPAA